MKHYNEIFKLNNAWNNNFNLHNHTIYSDWEHSVREIISEAKDKVITHLSITDHDTIGAYTKWNAMILGEGFWVNMIPWVEATFKMEKNIWIQPHMLMYFSELLLKDKKFLKDFNDSIWRARSKEFVESRIKKINEEFAVWLKLSDFDSMLWPSSYVWITSRHFRDVLFQKYNFSDEQIKLITWPNSPAYIAPWTEMCDILYLKNKYDMVSVMAHPFTKWTSKEQMLEVDKLIKWFIKNNSIDWLERFHPDTSKELENVIWNYTVPLFTWGSDTHYKEWWKSPLINQNVTDIINHDFNRLNWKWDLGLIVGRMNPPHIGHMRVIKNALNENSKVILLLGSADVINDKNIFTHAEKMLFFETYFADEIKSWRLIIDRIDDVWNNEIWVWNVWKTIAKHIPWFNKKLNIYGWDFKDDMAIKAFNECETELNIDDINYIEIPRDNFTMFDSDKKYDISATNLREALKSNDYDLAKKYIPKQIEDLQIIKWKEKNNLLKTKNIFIVAPPKWNRNYNSSKNIEDSIIESFDGKYIVEKPSDADMIVVLGWDGSLIWAIQQYWDLNIPFYPLAAWTANAIPAKYEQAYQLFSEDIETIKLNLLESEIFDDTWKLIDKIEWFNDIYLKAQNWEMWHLMVEADHYPRKTSIWDWLVISTPIWSTAYNKNAWGSVLDLQNNGLIITDIVWVWHTSDVISNDSVITITSIRWKFDIVWNSKSTYENFTMKIKKSDKFVNVILPKKEEFRQNRYKG